MNHQPRDGGGLLIGQFPVHHAVEVADRHRAIDIDRTIRLHPHTLHGKVMLVLDVADNFFENILQGHKAHHLAIFIDNKGEMGFTLQKGLKLVLQRGCIRHKPRIQRNIGNIELFRFAFGGIISAQQVFGMNHADNIVRIVAPQWQAGIGRGQHLAHQVFGREVNADGAHFGAVNHHIRNLQVFQVKQAAHHITVRALHTALAVQQVNRALQLLMTGENGRALTAMHAKQMEKTFDQRLHRHKHRPEQRHKK